MEAKDLMKAVNEANSEVLEGKPTWLTEAAARAVNKMSAELRDTFEHWGDPKIQALLDREGYTKAQAMEALIKEIEERSKKAFKMWTMMAKRG